MAQFLWLPVMRARADGAGLSLPRPLWSALPCPALSGIAPSDAPSITVVLIADFLTVKLHLLVALPIQHSSVGGIYIRTPGCDSMATTCPYSVLYIFNINIHLKNVKR